MFGWLKKRREPEISTDVSSDVDTADQEHAVYYRPHWHDFDDDGTLHIRVSIYNPDGHASGIMTVKADELNYSFWCWVIKQPEYHRSILEAELAAIREKFEAVVNKSSDL